MAENARPYWIYKKQNVGSSAMESNVAASLELSPDNESDLDLVYRVTETAMSALEDS